MDLHQFRAQLQTHLARLEGDETLGAEGDIDISKFRSKTKYRTPENTAPKEPEDPRVAKMRKKFGLADKRKKSDEK